MEISFHELPNHGLPLLDRDNSTRFFFLLFRIFTKKSKLRLSGVTIIIFWGNLDRFTRLINLLLLDLHCTCKKSLISQVKRT